MIQELGQRMKWAVVGTGRISHHMVQDMLEVDGIEVFAVCSRSRASAREFSEAYRIPLAFDDYDRLLSDPRIEVVYIATPHATHHRLAKRALLAGKHVLCEKPMALNAPEVRELAEIGARQNRFIMEAMWMRFSRAIDQILESVAMGRIGELRSVRASFGVAFPEDGSSRWNARLGGSALLDQGIYPATLSHMLLGPPETVTVHGTVREDGIDLTESFEFQYSGGRFAQNASSMVEFIDPSASINGTRGYITIPAPFWSSSSFSIHTPSQSDPTAAESFHLETEGNGYAPMLRAVCGAILEGQIEHPLNPMTDTISVFESLDAVRRELPQARDLSGGMVRGAPTCRGEIS